METMKSSGCQGSAGFRSGFADEHGTVKRPLGSPLGPPKHTQQEPFLVEKERARNGGPPLGTLLGPPWDSLGTPWDPLKTPLGPLGTPLRPPWDPLGAP
eukprot:1186257-Prorocentrum_minimum.AAC.2